MNTFLREASPMDASSISDVIQAGFMSHVTPDWAVRAHVEERYPEVKTVELNSTPYAVSAYRAWGFFPISEPFRRAGAAAIRMV
jgi:hypothetical protein